MASLVLLAVVGALSMRSSSALLFSESSVLTVFVLLAVEVRFRGNLVATKGAVSGGLITEGEAGLMDFKKSMYASGGVMGVFSGLSSGLADRSCLADSILGVGG